MENREQYKRLIMFFASALILLVQVVIFYYIWHRYYNYRSVIGALYWRRGNWALMGVYAFINFFFSKIFGAYKVGRRYDCNSEETSHQSSVAYRQSWKNLWIIVF